MDTVEGNKLIAEFMGFEKEQTLDGITVYAIPISRNNPTKINDIATEFFETEELRYHLSWDWLVEVVEHCLIITQEEEYHEWDLSIAESLRSVNKVIVYKELVQFIEWYNKNKIIMENLNQQFQNLVHNAQIDIANKAPFDLRKKLVDEFVSEEDILFDLPYIDFADSEGNGRIHAVITGMDDKGKLICRSTGSDFGEDHTATFDDVPAHSLFYLHEMLSE